MRETTRLECRATPRGANRFEPRWVGKAKFGTLRVCELGVRGEHLRRVPFERTIDADRS